MEYAEATKLRANALNHVPRNRQRGAAKAVDTRRTISNENRQHSILTIHCCAGPLLEGRRSRGCRCSMQVDHDARAVVMIAAGLRRAAVFVSAMYHSFALMPPSEILTATVDRTSMM